MLFIFRWCRFARRSALLLVGKSNSYVVPTCRILRLYTFRIQAGRLYLASNEPLGITSCLPTNRELIRLGRLACGDSAATNPQLLACYFCQCPAGAGVP